MPLIINKWGSKDKLLHSLLLFLLLHKLLERWARWEMANLSDHTVYLFIWKHIIEGSPKIHLTQQKFLGRRKFKTTKWEKITFQCWKCTMTWSNASVLTLGWSHEIHTFNTYLLVFHMTMVGGKGKWLSNTEVSIHCDVHIHGKSLKLRNPIYCHFRLLSVWANNVSDCRREHLIFTVF